MVGICGERHIEFRSQADGKRNKEKLFTMQVE